MKHQQLDHNLILSTVYIWLQFQVCNPVRANTRVCTRVTALGEFEISLWIFLTLLLLLLPSLFVVWIFWTLMLLFASLFVLLRRRFWQREDERAVEHEDLPHPIQAQDE